MARRVELLLFLAVFLSAAVVHHPRTGWNVNSRLALVFAVVDQRSLSIDAYHRDPERGTMDKARYGGHFYSDKQIGVSLLAMPVYALMRLAWLPLGGAPDFQQASYGLRLVAVSVPAGLAAVLLWHLMLRLGADWRRALLATLAVFFGSLLFGYATVFYPYLPGIAACLAALRLVLFPPRGALDRGSSLAAGALCGLALLCDFVFGLLVVGIAALLALRVAVEGGWLPERVLGGAARRCQRHGAALVHLGLAALAGALVLSIFLAYVVAIFDRPAIPYEFQAVPAFRTGMQQGWMGITRPRPATLWFLTLHPYRGVLFWTPLLLAALLGCGLALRRPGPRRIAGALGLASFAAYLIFNASYYMWWGGWAMGARHLLPVFAVVPLGLAELCRPETPRWLWRWVLALGVVSVALCLPLSLQNPQLDQGYQDAFLATVSIGTPLGAPQFDLLARFYGLGWLRSPDPWTALSYLAALAAPVALATLALRGSREVPS